MKQLIHILNTDPDVTSKQVNRVRSGLEAGLEPGHAGKLSHFDKPNVSSVNVRENIIEHNGRRYPVRRYQRVFRRQNKPSKTLKRLASGELIQR